MQIEKTAPVMVTGATGYVAGWLVKRLLEEGLTVHAPVRDPENAGKLKYLNEIAASTPGQIRFFRADLLDQGSYAEAMEGCAIVFHTASPFVIDVKDPQRDLDLTPQQVMNLLRLQLRELALGSRMVWDCVTCYQCQEHCPQGVEVADILYELRNEAVRRLPPLKPRAQCPAEAQREA